MARQPRPAKKFAPPPDSAAQSISPASPASLVYGTLTPVKLAVFVGTRGRGSNLRAIQGAIAGGRLDAEIVAVIGSQADAPAMVWAREAGLSTVRIDPRRHDEAAYAAKIVDALTESGADADRKSTRLNSSHSTLSRMPSSA